ncbi:MAG: hypothetical protein NTV89_15575, partial [Proteobacteria bacterium]|nr:hypothetical protein [Pseudomonadota bacterium]
MTIKNNHCLLSACIVLVFYCAVVSDCFAYQINLSQGWNLISLPEQPQDPAIAQVTSPIAGKFTAVWAYVNGAWKLYDPANAGFSDLSAMQPGIGYWIKMTQSGTLSGSGTAAPSSVALTAGWNLVGYCGTAAKALTDALQSISGQYSAVWAYMNGTWKLYDPANAGFSDLSQMEPGYGYWIKATQGCVLNFGGSTAGTTISPASGGTVSASDGASVSFAPDFGLSDITVSFSKVADASGAIVDDRKIISAKYSLQIAGAETIGSN